MLSVYTITCLRVKWVCAELLIVNRLFLSFFKSSGDYFQYCASASSTRYINYQSNSKVEF